MHQNKSNIKAIPFEEIASFPSPGNSYPDNFKFSPNNKFLTYLFSENKSLSRSLWLLDLNTKTKKLLFDSTSGSEEDLSPAERLRRERQRQLTLGVTNYSWADKVNKLFFNTSEGIYGINFDIDIKVNKIVDLTNREIIDPQISPDGKWIGYVLEKELYITSFDGKITKQITFKAKEKNVTHGIAEYVAQEEMARSHGFWWSPDSKKIAFTEVDEKHIPIFKIINQTKENLDKESVDEIIYPFAGKENAYVKLGVVYIENEKLNWMDLGTNKDVYLTRVNWFTDEMLTAQIENREQTVLDLIKFDIINGKASPILKEQSKIWINLHNMLRVLDNKTFIWASERTGFKNLYLYDFQGKLLRTITQGEYVVEEICGINNEKGLLYAITTAKNPTQRHLYEYKIETGEGKQLTKTEGTHVITMNPKCDLYIDIFSSLTIPPRVTMKSVTENNNVLSIFEDRDPKIDEFDLRSPSIVEIPLPDKVPLYGAIYKPDESFGPGPYPTIVVVYGGPSAQMVVNNWNLTSGLMIQNFLKHGFLVFIADNRGSFHRGLQFEGVLKGQFGKYEVEDQVYCIEWLINSGLADKNRIGITGWSYGGYMSLMCLSKASNVYKAAFAGAPTNDMKDYDTYYTERYLGKPQDNPEGYLQTCVMSHLSNMTGKLTIAHGLIDENVHFRNTAKLINKLIELQKDYSLILFPNGRHSLRKKEDRIYLEQKRLDFFIKSL